LRAGSPTAVPPPGVAASEHEASKEPSNISAAARDNAFFIDFPPPDFSPSMTSMIFISSYPVHSNRYIIQFDKQTEKPL